MQLSDGRVASEESSVDDSCLILNSANVFIPTACEYHALVHMHLADIDWILELEDPVTDSQRFLIQRPLPERAIVGAGEHFTNSLDDFHVVDLVGMPKEWSIVRRLLAWLKLADVPAANEPITIA